MKFIAESADEIKLAAIATAGEASVKAFVAVLGVVGKGGPKEMVVFLEGMERVAETSFARVARLAEVGEV